MELYLQFGWGMMEHCRQLIRAWGGGTVILSPRDLTHDQLVRLGHDLRRIHGTVLLDPQFYLPHADHERLLSHIYWPGNYDSIGFWSGPGLSRLLTRLFALNQQTGCDDIILPGLHAVTVDPDWLSRQQAIVEEGAAFGAGRYGLFATVALGEEAIRHSEQIDAVLDGAEAWRVKGVYLVCEHPRGEYLVGDPNWLAGVVDLAAGLRLQGKQVIIGYCHHQMLIAACTATTAIASGTWMNVRSFPPEKFRAPYDEERKTRATWYYSPQALSEFKIPFLDVAQRQGVLELLATPTLYNSPYADALFRGRQPSSAAFAEPEAFRHYLHCLRFQVGQARGATFDTTADAHERTLDGAARLLERVHGAGVFGQHRDFGEIVAVNLAALRVLESERGAMLRRHWHELQP
jgi:hypothetical protein